MALRKIIKMPNSFLRKKASAIDTIDNDIKHILDDMLETMYNAYLYNFDLLTKLENWILVLIFYIYYTILNSEIYCYYYYNNHCLIIHTIF